MKITNRWIKENQPCKDGVKWFWQQTERDGLKVVKKLIKENQLIWANWLIVRLMDRKQKIQYACFAAREVLDIFEKKYPEDKRPRQAIEAAEKCVAANTKKNRIAAAYAANAAANAAYAANAAAYAANAAADAADAAADAAYAAYAANAAAYAADAAADAADAAYAAMRIKILEFGIKLLKKGKI